MGKTEAGKSLLGPGQPGVYNESLSQKQKKAKPTNQTRPNLPNQTEWHLTVNQSRSIKISVKNSKLYAPDRLQSEETAIMNKY